MKLFRRPSPPGIFTESRLRLDGFVWQVANLVLLRVFFLVLLCVLFLFLLFLFDQVRDLSEGSFLLRRKSVFKVFNSVLDRQNVHDILRQLPRINAVIEETQSFIRSDTSNVRRQPVGGGRWPWVVQSVAQVPQSFLAKRPNVLACHCPTSDCAVCRGAKKHFVLVAV